MDLVLLRKKFRSQESLRSNIEQVWDEIDYYTGPVREEGSSSTSPSSGTDTPQGRKDLWDFAAIEGREKLAASIHGAVTSPAIRWFSLSFRNSKLNRDQVAKAWLDEVAEDLWNDIQDSDFNTEIGSAYHELTGPGNSFVAMEGITDDEEWGGFDFTAIPLNECYFEQDRKGGIRTFWRKHSWDAAQVVSLCEERGWEAPERVQKAYDEGKTDRFEVIFCIFPRPRIQKRKKLVYPAAPENRPWGSVFWMGDNGERVGEEGGYYEMPVFLCRWARTSGSKWGHGPGNIALPSVKYLNARMENRRMAEELALNPPVIASERNLTSDVDRRPGRLTFARDPEQVKTLESNHRFDVDTEGLMDLRNQIRQIFHTDDLELKESPAMTATEAQIRYEWLNRLLGKTLTFIQNDLLGPVILTGVAMKQRLGLLPPRPKNVKDTDVFNIEYQGPLSRSQRTDEVAAIERGAAFVAGLTQIFPESKAGFDPIKAVKHVFERLGIPADMIPSEDQIKKSLAAMAEEQARAVAAESAQKEARAMKDASQAVPQQVGLSLPPVPPMALGGRPMGRIA